MDKQKTYRFKASNWNKEQYLADMRFIATEKRRIARELNLQADTIEEYALKLEMQLIEVEGPKT